MIIISLFVVKYAKNSMQMLKEFKLSTKNALFGALLFYLSVFGLSRVSEFIYFNF
jgi:hypothetical protein